MTTIHRSSLSDTTADLQHYLRGARDAVIWKLENLDDCDLRRPLTRTGTNLLGLVQHLSRVEVLYFVAAFGRPATWSVPWFAAQIEPNSDMWATPEQPADHIVTTYRRAWAHADSTLDIVDLQTVGCMPWLSERHMSLRRAVVHVIAETERHAGHADITREFIDGAAGRLPDDDQLNTHAEHGTHPRDPNWWDVYYDTVDNAARVAADADNVRVAGSHHDRRP